MTASLWTPGAYLGRVGKLAAWGSTVPERPPLAAYVVVPLVYWLSAAVGSRLVLTPDGISLLWAPNAILLAALVRFQGGGWAGFVLCGLLAEIVADWGIFPVPKALVFGCTNVFEVTLGWLLLERWRFTGRFGSIGDVGHFVLAIPLVAALCGAVVGTFLLSLSGYGPVNLDTVPLWWFGDALGLLIFTPLYLSLWLPRANPTRRIASRPLVDAVMLTCGLGLLALVAFSHDGVIAGVHLRPVLLLPFVLYAAVRLPLASVCLTVMAVSMLMVALTVAGRAPYGGSTPEESAVLIQEFVLVTSVLSLGLSALLESVRTADERTQRANAELRRQAKALEQSNAELRRIAFVAAHDLQTPLRGICRFSQLLREHPGPSDLNEDWIRRITENSSRLEALLRDLGTLASVDASAAPHTLVPMGPLLDEVAWDLRGVLGEAGAVLHHAPLPTVRGDREQLCRLLKELVCNAVKFRGADPPRVEVSARADPCEWVFSVRDNGIGVAPEDRQQIFELFYRPAAARGLPGTGFGLAMCTRIVHRHGGRIWVEPTTGSGSTFCFTLPRTDET